VPLAAAVQPADGLLEKLQRPWQGQEDQLAAAFLKVKPMPCAGRVGQKDRNRARIPSINGAPLVERYCMREAAL